MKLLELKDLTPFDTTPATSLPSTLELLAGGGDARIAIGSNGFNRYGCRPIPEPHLLAFGSSTASTISEAGFLAADQLRNALQSRLSRSLEGEEEAEKLYASELDRIRDELATLCGIDEELRPDMVFAASGTDLHLIAASLVSRNDARPLQVVIAGADETGRGVPAAVTGRHFSSTSALGYSVTDGQSCLENGNIHLHTVALRTADGTARTMAEVDNDVEKLVRQAVTARQRVLLIVVDVSKTGIIAPSPACAMSLRQDFPDSVDVMVDGCQFRLAPATIQSYLEHGFMLALTGSKFLTGLSFSGALMIPYCLASTMRQHALPTGLAAYSCRADWPAAWASTHALSRRANFGLLLRWEAALAELRQFAVVPEQRIRGILVRFKDAVNARLHKDVRFEPLPLPALHRAPVTASNDWDSITTIFPFIPCCMDEHGDRRRLSRQETTDLYHHLQSGSDANSSTTAQRSRMELGQPVSCGTRDGVELSALRLCMSTRLVVNAAIPGNEDAVINQAMRVLDEVARLAALAQ